LKPRRRALNAGGKIDVAGRALMLWELQPPNPPSEDDDPSPK